MPEALHDWALAAATAVMGGAAAALLFMRSVMTKKEHTEYCTSRVELFDQKIEVVKSDVGAGLDVLKTEVKHVKEEQVEQKKLLEKMDKKLDRVLVNGGAEGG